MGRRPGSLNRDYDETYDRLALATLPALLRPDGADASLRELAGLAGISTPTLLHYFGSREGVWRAALEAMGRVGAIHMATVADAEVGELEASSRFLLTQFSAAWSQYGVAAMFRAGLQLGLKSSGVGPVFVESILEPVLVMAERRLQRHADAGELDPDVRAASLALMSPVVLAFLHQGALGGDTCRPLDLEQFIHAHHRAWLRGWSLR